MNVTLTNVSLYCTASKKKKKIVDPPTVMFVGFFHEKYLPAMNKYIMVIPPHPHCVQWKYLMRN